MRNLLLLFILLNLAFVAVAQNTKPKPSLIIKKATGKIIIDGELNEPDWSRELGTDVAKDFFQNQPYDTSYAETKTEVRVTYDDDFLYIGAICFDSIPGDYIIQSLKRDFSYPVSDAFAVYIAPFNDKVNGFSFAVNPLGVQREGLISGGGPFGVTTSWDNKWRSKVVRYDNKWSVEMAIPFKTLRYKEGVDKWGINFSRNNLKRNENSSWSPVPRNFNIASLAYTGDLIFDEPPKKAGANISFIPYAIGGINRDFLADNIAHSNVNAGLDAKIAVTSSLNLDITINPDYSQVEVDRQIINLTRFNLFFPEKRQFFIENSDLFAQFGFRQIRPFFSRNIGLFEGQIVPIIAGARISGNINKAWRIGLMNMQTAQDTTLGLKPQNYTVAAFQRILFGRSNIAGIFVNRQGLTDTEINYTDYNRILGLDFNLRSNNNQWLGKAFYHHSFTPQFKSDNYTHAVWLMHNSQNIFAMWNHEYVGENYITDVGFVPRLYHYNPDIDSIIRKSYWRFEPEFNYRFYPKSKKVLSYTPGIYMSRYFDKEFNSTEYFIKVRCDIVFQNKSAFNVDLMDNFTRLFFPTDISRLGKKPLPAKSYRWQNIKLERKSDQRKKAYYYVEIDYGTFYNGTKISYKAELNYRKQPWGIFSFTFSQDEVKLPDPYKNFYLTLVGPKIELSFTKSLFFTTFIQYNTQLENVNINSRFQWRFKPMSDLYIVYTDNYYSPNISIKNRAVVVKLIYWFTP